MKPQPFIIIFTALAQSAFAHASNDTRLQHFLSLSLEAVVSLETTIATNSKCTASEAPATVTLITADDIKATDFMRDSTVRFAHSGSWEFAASVRNLFDVNAWEYTGSAIADDFPLPERDFYSEMRYKF